MSRLAATNSVLTERQLDWIIDVSQVWEPPALRPECCIYRVPEELRKANINAYTPKLISIGPLHHGSKELSDMEQLKVRYFKLYCDRVLKGNEGGASTTEEKEVQLQNSLAKIVEDNSEEIRHCYAEWPPLGHEGFVIRMILLDATFIIELLLRDFGDTGDLRNDYILSRPRIKRAIWQDLILLENQLPIFILEKIHEQFSMHVTREKTDFFTLAGSYLSTRSYYDEKKSGLMEVKHFTDLLRYLFCLGPNRRHRWWINPFIFRDRDDERTFMLRAGPNSEDHKRTFKYIPSASNLEEAGVKFKKVEGGLLDIEFNKFMCMEWIPCLPCTWLLACLPCFRCFPCLVSMQPFLELPGLVVDDSTETVFRNLMALEQCHYPSGEYICNYILLLNSLIKAEKDVEMLVSKMIIENQLNSNNAVATMINKLCEEIVVTNSYFQDLSISLHKHCNTFWNKAMATARSTTLRREYFPNIWKGSGTVVGLIILGFTLWGFIRSYFPHDRPGG